MPVLTWMYENEGYKEYAESSRAWKCPLCGDVQRGGDPPMECPYCLAPGKAFTEVGKRRPVSVRQEKSRIPARTPAPENRALFHKYMRQEAKEWSMSIRSWSW